MPSYVNPSRVFEYASPDRVVKRGGDTVKPTGSTQAIAVNRTENEEARSTVLTLDDFGGRSDALGG
jgi:hypothetical protein